MLWMLRGSREATSFWRLDQTLFLAVANRRLRHDSAASRSPLRDIAHYARRFVTDGTF